MTQPIISICIPTYNGSKYLMQALESIEEQTFRNFEVIVSDDNSSDITWKILEKFKSEADYSIQLFKHTPSGIGANWNNCLRNARGKYIKFLFQDDVLDKDCLEIMVNYLDKNPNVALVGCKRNFILEKPPNNLIKDWIKMYNNLQSQFEKEEEVTYIDSSLFNRKDFLISPLNKIGEPPTVMFRKEILKKTGYFDEQMKQILDFVFYYRILKKYPIAIINKPLVKFRIHEAQATNVNRNSVIDDHSKYDKILYKEFLPYLHPHHKNRLKLKFSSLSRKKALINKLLRRVYKKIIR